NTSFLVLLENTNEHQAAIQTVTLWRQDVVFTTETQVVRRNRSADVSPASEPRQLLLGQHDLCRLEAGDTFFLTTTEGPLIADWRLRISDLELMTSFSIRTIRNPQSAIQRVLRGISVFSVSP